MSPRPTGSHCWAPIRRARREGGGHPMQAGCLGPTLLASEPHCRPAACPSQRAPDSGQEPSLGRERKAPPKHSRQTGGPTGAPRPGHARRLPGPATVAEEAPQRARLPRLLPRHQGTPSGARSHSTRGTENGKSCPRGPQCGSLPNFSTLLALQQKQTSTKTGGAPSRRERGKGRAPAGMGSAGSTRDGSSPGRQASRPLPPPRSRRPPPLTRFSFQQRG